MGGEECDQFSDREVALGPAADLGDQLMKGERSTVVFLQRFGEDDGVDRREPQVGEESGLFAESGSRTTTPVCSERIAVMSSRISVRDGTEVTSRLLLEGPGPGIVASPCGDDAEGILAVDPRAPVSGQGRA